MRIFIYGVPGAGKTYYSKVLGKKLNILVFEADKLKNKVFPFQNLGTCLAYKRFGELTPENARKGLFLVRDALRDAVEKEIPNKSELIVEGAFLDPHSLIKFGKLMLIITPDEKKHKSQFLKHREKVLDLQENEFKAARMIQEYLIIEAKRLGTKIIENSN